MATISGGDKLGAALRKIASNVSKASSVSVGFLEGSTEPDGTSIPMIAAIQEFGAPGVGIPPRPFFRTMIAKHSSEWPDAIKENLKTNNYDGLRTLNQIGSVIAGELQQSIVDTNDPALSPVTVMLRGMRKQKRYRDLPFGELITEARARVEAGKTSYGASTKPLVDSGSMLNSVDYDVK